MLKAFIAFFLFIVTQIVGSSVALLWVNKSNLSAGKDLDPSLLLAHPEYNGVAMFWASLVLIGILLLTKIARKSAITSLWKSPALGFGRALIGFIIFSLGVSFILAPLNLNDFGTSEMFHLMKDNVWCLLLICIVGPLTEELVFREGVVRHLAYKRLQPVTAAIVGAVLFGVVHGNPAQMLPAAFIGFILGIFYVRTGNIQLCAAAHIFNNSVAVVLFFFPTVEHTMENLPLSSSLVIGGVLAAVGFSILLQWWKQSTPSLIEREVA